MSEQESVWYYTVWRGFTPVVITMDGFRLRHPDNSIMKAYRFQTKYEAEHVAAQLGCDVQESYGPLEVPAPSKCPKLSKPWPTKHPHK